jgi:hypothetical protein
METGYLKEDIREVISFKSTSGRRGLRPRSWFAKAYRVVDKDDRDMIFPWALSKKEAMETAKALNIDLKEISE